MIDERKQGWEWLLNKYINDRMLTPFEWGKTDCSLFAAKWIDVSRETNICQMFEGKYKTLLGAKKILKEYSGGWVEETAVKIANDFGFPEINISFAKRGDAMLLKTETAEMGLTHILGINTPPGIFVQGLKGLLCMSRSKAIRAWSI